MNYGPLFEISSLCFNSMCSIIKSWFYLYESASFDESGVYWCEFFFRHLRAPLLFMFPFVQHCFSFIIFYFWCKCSLHYLLLWMSSIWISCSIPIKSNSPPGGCGFNTCWNGNVFKLKTVFQLFFFPKFHSTSVKNTR